MRNRVDPPRPVTLDFSGSAAAEAGRHDLSAATADGDTLWLGSDEGTCLVRLTRVADDRWGDAVDVDLANLVDLPGAADDEIDVEGIDVSGGALWVTGSHSVVRRKPDEELSPAKRLRRLARTSRKGNRHLVARLPLVADAAGRPLPGPGARRLPGTRSRDALTRALRDDPHLGAWLDVPGKDNGFDIEGLAVHGERLWLGLRSPVLRGTAVILALHPADDPDDAAALRLRRCGPGGRRYEKFFLDLYGLGVRELCADGDDLLVLAGPSMVLDGRCTVLRWRGARHARGDAFVTRDALEPVVELPYGHGDEERVDHPEGLALLVEDRGGPALLVVHDSPAAGRARGSTVVADLYPVRSSTA
ncbi:DUF3616 domain-containing protein [Roseisolibacter sp. H3M3-2]|uniref:DUF3616 domain-containing protein n=1 Tax=Roseisolibacter sp. H3M3-2 TaxID=3031323 RepID=UPI0023D9D96A|nr:DUF3616 domain-containing protein [Roseisolibacter sp. H3M3-2]MDF1504396.1 DUF3616 domain-containing protein [Roseisolibacter sp. H3M3-2]